MTLILSCITREYVVQASDRKVTAIDGTWFEDQRNKAVFFCGHSAFAYTGLASLNSLPTDEWLTLELGKVKALTDGFPHIAREAKVALDRINFDASVSAEERKKRKRLAFVNVAFMLDQGRSQGKIDPQYLIPIITVVSNFFRPPNTWLPQASEEFQAYPGYLENNKRFALFSAGQSLRPNEHKDLMDQLGHCIARAKTGYPVARLLARQIRLVADRNAKVGRNVMCSIIPREAVIRDVGQPPVSGMILLDTEKAKEPDFFHFPKNEPLRKTYIYIPDSLSEKSFYGPNYACEGILVKDFKMEINPDGTVSAKVLVRDAGHPGSR